MALAALLLRPLVLGRLWLWLYERKLAGVVKPAMFSLILLLSWSSLAAAKTKSIFILAGQSNMVGRGNLVNGTWDRVVPPECSPNPLILRLNALLEWEEAKEPLHLDIDVKKKACGIGPGMVFANSILKRNSSIGTIGLVPCAIGGTSITEWRSGRKYYKRMVKRAKAAVRGGGKVRGMLWYQGESDAEIEENAFMYRTRLENFFTDVRSDLRSPGLPIIQVAIKSNGTYVEKIRQVQLENRLPNLTTVDAKDLVLQDDGLHLNTLSQVELGKMLADAWLLITGHPPAHIISLPEIP